MFQDKYVFSQLTAFLNRTQFNTTVKIEVQHLRRFPAHSATLHGRGNGGGVALLS